MNCLIGYVQNSARATEHDISSAISGHGALMPMVTNTQAEADYLTSMALMMGVTVQVLINDPGRHTMYCWISIPELSQGANNADQDL